MFADKNKLLLSLYDGIRNVVDGEWMRSKKELLDC